MKRRIAPTLAVLLLALALPLNMAAHAAPSPQRRHLAVLEDQTQAGPFDMIFQVLEFAPGTWTSVQASDGPSFILVTAGTVTYRAGGTDKTFGVGQSWTAPANELGAVGNAGTAPATALVEYRVPQGAAITTPAPNQPQPAAPRPTVRAQVRLDAVAQAGVFDQILAVLDWSPASVQEAHYHPAPVMVIVLEGALTLREQGKAPRVVAAGGSWIERTGDVHDTVNESGAPAAFAVMAIAPKGQPPSFPVTPAPETPGLPNTGAGGATRQAAPPWLLLPLAGGAIGAGTLLRHRRARRG